MFDAIGLDADDTLWHNESLYHATQEKFRRLVAPYVSGDGVAERLYQIEVGNIPYFGYGIKSFILSMVEAAHTITGGRISSAEIAQIVGYAREMLDAPVRLLPHVAEVVPALAARWPLIVITKGDLLDQHRKVERSGLGRHFHAVEVVNEKDQGVYGAILARYSIDPRRFVMVGNSVKSDILPVVALGGRGVHVPYVTTWAHEEVAPEVRAAADYVELPDLGGLPALLERWQGAAEC